jgi:protein gp37
MSDKSLISWCDSTWNPTQGCTKVSAGCAHCYAERWSKRFRKSFDLRLVPEALDLPLHWKKPRRIFVDSMSDLFHPDVPDEFLDRVFAMMLADRVFEFGPRHTFLVLTKRPGRMRRYLDASPVDLLQRWAHAGDGLITMDDADVRFSDYVGEQCAAVWDQDGRASSSIGLWSHPKVLFPLFNLWLGVSVENQETADDRIPILLDTPAAHRFVSAEPLLSRIGLKADWFKNNGVNWIVTGGESGPGARPCDVSWIRSIVAQCAFVGVPCFMKQLGTRPALGLHGSEGSKTGWSDLPYLQSMKHRSGADPSEWTPDLRVQQFPEGLCPA